MLVTQRLIIAELKYIRKYVILLFSVSFNKLNLYLRHSLIVQFD